MKRSPIHLIGSPTYGKWPWPSKLPLKKNWFHQIRSDRSVASENRTYNIVGDLLLCGVVGYCAFRAYILSTQHNAYQNHLCHLNNHPPAIIANEFDFHDDKKNRKVQRRDLDDYRTAVVVCKADSKPVESIIFKY